MGVRRRAGFADIGLRLAALTLAYGFLVQAAQGAQSGYAGRYAGVGRAAGMSMRLYQSGDKVIGDVADGRSARFTLSGRVGEASLTGSLYNAAGAAIFEMTPKPSGLAFVLVPVTSKGEPNENAEVRYSFARARSAKAMAGLASQQPPTGDAAADALAFVLNYRRWQPSSLIAAYDGLSASDRALINVFDHVQADVMVRLCRANAPTSSFKTIAQNERIDCRTLETLAAKADRKGGLKRFDQAAAGQRASLVVALRCRYKAAPESECADVGKTTSFAAVRWTNAGRIFASLAGEEAVAMGTAPVALAAVAPRSPEARATPRRARRSASVPVIPRARPLLVADIGGTTAAVGLSDADLARADQSAKVEGQAPVTQPGGSFGFELRPTPSERKELSQSLGAILPGPLADRLRGGDEKPKEPAVTPEFVQTGQGRIPLPRPRPQSHG